MGLEAMNRVYPMPLPGHSSGRRSLDERLAAARASEERALARFQRKNAAAEKLQGQKRQRDRKLDTRRKIIAGAIALEHCLHDPAFAAAFRALLDRHVTKLPERALFGLPVSINGDRA